MTQEATERDSGAPGVMRSSALMALGTAVSRVLGLFRATLLAGAIGTAASGDAFSVANTVPNNLYILLAGGVLNAVLVPQITRAAADPDGGREYLDRLITVSLTILLGATIVMTAAAPLLVGLYASRFDSGLLWLATMFAYLCLPQLFFYGLYTLLGQVLNARGSFGPYMWAPVANNIVAIAGLLIFIQQFGGGDRCADAWSPASIGLLAGTATAGVIVQALVLIPALRRIGFSYRPRWGFRGVGLGTASRVAGWTFAAVLIAQIGYIVTSRVTTAGGSAAREATASATQLACAVASSGVAPGKATYDYAFLLFMLPHSLVTVSLVTALFTRMSQAAVRGSIREVREDLSMGLRLTGIVTILATAAFIAIGPDIAATILPKNTAAETEGIARVAAAMSIGLMPFSAQYLFQRVFYVFEDAKTPFFIQVPVVLTWMIGNGIALLLLPAAWIVVGVGLAMSVSNILGACLSAAVLHRRLTHLDGYRVLGAHLRMALAAAISGLAAWALSRGIHASLPADPTHGQVWLSHVAATFSGCLLMAVLYAVLLKVMGVTELSEMLSPLLRKVRKNTR